jgi:molybdopterin converting factor small subunit
MSGSAGLDGRAAVDGRAGVDGTVTVRYWAAAREAAGSPEETLVAATLADALAEVARRHPGRLPDVLRCCSYLVDGAPTGTRPPAAVVLAPGAVVEVLPPFAGG